MSTELSDVIPPRLKSTYLPSLLVHEVPRKSLREGSLTLLICPDWLFTILVNISRVVHNWVHLIFTLYLTSGRRRNLLVLVYNHFFDTLQV